MISHQQLDVVGNVYIYCSKDVLSALKMEFSYIFSDFKYPGVPKVNVNLFNSDEFYIENTKVIPIKAMHYKLPVHGFRIKNFVYLTDLSKISENEKNINSVFSAGRWVVKDGKHIKREKITLKYMETLQKISKSLI